MMRFILFDIDGTLIDSGGAGVKSLNLAFEEMFSVNEAFKTISMAGKTDLQIIREGLSLHRIDHSNGVIPEFFSSYTRHLKGHIDNRRGHVMTGIREALDILCSKNDYVLGLLTGNIEEGARIKLGHYGLDSYFSIGAFGSDSEDRNELLPLAVEKLYKSSSVRVSYRDCFVIGDTPRDIECSKPYGAVSVAVATGPYSARELSEAGADEVFEDLSDTERFMRVIEGRETRER